MKDQMQRQKTPGNSKRKLDSIKQAQSEYKREDNFYGPAVQREVSPQEQSLDRLSKTTLQFTTRPRLPL